jgi:type II secretory pathway component PulF
MSKLSKNTSVWQSHPFVLGVVAVVVALAFIITVAPAVQAVNTTGMTGLELGLVQIAQLLTTSAPIAIIAGFAWSLFGYLRYKAGDNTVNYDLTQLAQTVAWFMGIITPFTYGLNAVNLNGVPLATIIAQGFMTFKAVINQLQTTTQQNPPPQASDPPKSP